MSESELELRVKKSIIGKGGRARVCESAFESLELEEGDLITVHHHGNSILVEAYSDFIVEDGYLRIRYNDMERLSVVEESDVEVSKYESVRKGMKTRVKKIIKR